VERKEPSLRHTLWNSRPPLTEAAQRHAETMAETGCFSHDATGSRPCPDGTSCGRIAQAGFQWAAVGENIAAGAEDLEEVMVLWLSSDGHCANILRPEFSRLGAGVARMNRADSIRPDIWRTGLGDDPRVRLAIPGRAWQSRGDSHRGLPLRKAPCGGGARRPPPGTLLGPHFPVLGERPEQVTQHPTQSPATGPSPAFRARNAGSSS